MHHAHVKRKENQMKTVTSKGFRLNPDTVGILQARARRARSQAMHNLAVRFISWLAARFNGDARHPFGIRWG